MPHFMDVFSKRLAAAVSRRDMLRIASGALVSATLASTGITPVWARTPRPGGLNSSICGAVQKSIQLGSQTLAAANVPPDQDEEDEDDRTHRSSQKLARHARRLTRIARKARLIDEDCVECIISQFEAGTPVFEQYACGPLTEPSVLCDVLDPPAEQIEATSVLAFSAAPNALTEAPDWAVFEQLTEAMLGCQLSSQAHPAASTAAAVTGTTTGLALAAQALRNSATASGCDTPGTPGVDYCGKGNSVENPVGTVTAAQCLNAGCFAHDNCYESNCVPNPCYFTAQSAACDAPLLQICQSSCATKTATSQVVCSIVKCATGAVLDDPNATVVCDAIFAVHSAICAKAGGVPSQCENTKCDPNISVCGSVCCPCGLTCANGACVGTCAPGETQCASQCCSPSQSCVNNTCVSACPAGQISCGATCCASTEVCTNGQCVASGCPTNQVLCGSTCCAPGQICYAGSCMVNPCTGSGLTLCQGSGITCCDSTQMCCRSAVSEVCIAASNTCCIAGNGTIIAGGCPPGYTCCANATVSFCCPPADPVCVFPPTGPGCTQ